jgi:hypothetical protein
MSTVLSPITPTTRSLQLGAAIGRHPLLLASLITALVTAFRLTGTVDSDVAWQLWIAGRIHAGANLYTDIIETNPPLWFWMALPLDRAAGLLHLRIDTVLILAIGLCECASLAALNLFLVGLPKLWRTLLLGYVALALSVIPGVHVGQREHIVWIFSLPYVALAASRLRGSRVPAWQAALIGVAAGLGFGLKHYFLLVPLLLECWLLWSRRDTWRPFRPETIALAVIGAAYAVAIVLVEPDYITTIVPLLRLAYGAFAPPSLIYLFGPLACAGLVAIGFLGTQIRRLRGQQAPLAAAFAIAALGFAFVYFWQCKGWRYHAIPMTGYASIAVAALLCEIKPRARPLPLLAPALLIMPLYLAIVEEAHLKPDRDLAQSLSGLHPGTAVGFITTETAVPWSVTLQGNYRYPSRYNGFWMMFAILQNESAGHPNPKLDALGRQIVAETVKDFRCIPPQRIVVVRPRPGDTTYDMLPFFLRDANFARLLSHYRIRSRTSFETYELAQPFPTYSGPCREGV